MSFTKRKIDLIFRLGTGKFGEEGYDEVKLSGHRVNCSITKTSGPLLGEARLMIYGLTKSLMNQLTALNPAMMLKRKNTLVILAGDDVNGMAIVFEGQISLGKIDLNRAPDAPLVMLAIAGYWEGIKPVAPNSYPGSVDAAVVMSNLAAQMGYAFENNGVSVILSTPYFAGALKDQAVSCARAAHINWIIDDSTLVIWPKNGSRSGASALITKDTGMVGYPSYGSGDYGIEVKTLFNPSLRIGKTVLIYSKEIDVANGEWVTFNITHNLESETPDGEWFTYFTTGPYSVVHSIIGILDA